MNKHGNNYYRYKIVQMHQEYFNGFIACRLQQTTIFLIDFPLHDISSLKPISPTLFKTFNHLAAYIANNMNPDQTAPKGAV